MIAAEGLAMRCGLVIIAAALAGCATASPDQALAQRHAANLAAAAKEDYSVVSKDGQNLFCPTRPSTGSHVIAGCLTEAQFEIHRLWVWNGSGPGLGGESGRPNNSGSLAPYVGH